jgi:hypothetical protein
VDPVPDPLLLRKSGRAENRTRTSGSVARNCDHDERGGKIQLHTIIKMPILYRIIIVLVTATDIVVMKFHMERFNL